MSREPNIQIQPIPAGLLAPSEVKDASAVLVESRARFFELCQERADHEQAIREAQAADVQATKEAIGAGEPTPKAKATAVIVRGEELAREIEAARSIAIEAEDAYLAVSRSHRIEWLADLQAERERSREQERAALDQIRRIRSERLMTEHAISEVQRLDDQSKLKDPAKTTMYGIFDLRSSEDFDRAIEREIGSLRKMIGLRKNTIVPNEPAALIAALSLNLEPEAGE